MRVARLKRTIGVGMTVAVVALVGTIVTAGPVSAAGPVLSVASETRDANGRGVVTLTWVLAPTQRITYVYWSTIGPRAGTTNLHLNDSNLGQLEGTSRTIDRLHAATWWFQVESVSTAATSAQRNAECPGGCRSNLLQLTITTPTTTTTTTTTRPPTTTTTAPPPPIAAPVPAASPAPVPAPDPGSGRVEAPVAKLPPLVAPPVVKAREDPPTNAAPPHVNLTCDAAKTLPGGLAKAVADLTAAKNGKGLAPENRAKVQATLDRLSACPGGTKPDDKAKPGQNNKPGDKKPPPGQNNKAPDDKAKPGGDGKTGAGGGPGAGGGQGGGATAGKAGGGQKPGATAGKAGAKGKSTPTTSKCRKFTSTKDRKTTTKCK